MHLKCLDILCNAIIDVICHVCISNFVTHTVFIANFKNECLGQTYEMLHFVFKCLMFY